MIGSLQNGEILMQTAPVRASDEDGEMNLVEMWLRRDPKRWIAGALAGILAGTVAMAFGVILSLAVGYEPWFPLKVPAVIFLGGSATEYGLNFGVMVLGFVIFEVLATFLGVLYAQATQTNYLPALLGVGFIWGVFTWIFIFNLYIQSWTQIFALQLSSGGTFFVAMVFGLALTSVAFFDRALRGGRG